MQSLLIIFNVSLGTLLSLIDGPVHLLKRRPILYAGSFVVVRFVDKLPESPTAGRAWCIWAILVGHSSVRVNTNYLLECGPRIR